MRIKGVNTVRKKLADGTVKVFHYHRATGTPLPGKPGSAEFMAAFAAAGEKMRSAPSGTFMSVIAKYKASAEYKLKSEKTKKDYLRYAKLIETEFGDMPLAAVNDPRVRGEFLEWRDEVADKPRTADYRWSVLGLILSWGKNRNLITHNACERGGRLYKGGNRAEIVWKPEDIKKLMTTASPEVMAVVFLALWTGQRQGDLLRLPWSAYDGKVIRLKQSKTGKRVSIPCGDTLRAFLDALPRKSTQILVNTKGNPWTLDGFRSSFWTACTAAEIDDLHFHDLRGTAVTRLALSGCSVPEIAAITGHSLKDVEMLLDAHYLGGRVELAEQAALKLESRYGETPALLIDGTSEK